MAPSKEEKNFLLELIDIYRSFRALWKVKRKEYSDRNKEDDAYERLFLKFCEWYKDGTKDELTNINSLRTNFRKELEKVNDSLKFGARNDEIYEPS